MLSHDEDRQLRAIEQYFEESDPKLTRMLRAHEAPGSRRQRRALRMAIDAIGVLLFLFGMVAAQAVLMVFGILVMAAGACIHLAGRSTQQR